MILSIYVIPLGTGLTMNIKNGFNSTNKLRNFLSKFGFLFNNHYDIMQWFVGWVRFTITFVEEWLNNNCDIDVLFKKFKEDYTDPVSNKSIIVKIVNWINKNTI